MHKFEKIEKDQALALIELEEKGGVLDIKYLKNMTYKMYKTLRNKKFVSVIDVQDTEFGIIIVSELGKEILRHYRMPTDAKIMQKLDSIDAEIFDLKRKIDVLSKEKEEIMEEYSDALSIAGLKLVSSNQF